MIIIFQLRDNQLSGYVSSEKFFIKVFSRSLSRSFMSHPTKKISLGDLLESGRQFLGIYKLRVQLAWNLWEKKEF